MTPDTRVALETLLALAKAWAAQAPNAELRVLIDRGKQAAERALAEEGKRL